MTPSATWKQPSGKPIQRLASIDVFRAVTMFLMIFVNDVDGVRQIPGWIKHVSVDQSGLGFADVIFPAFLFIVGLSLPLAVRGKLQQGYTTAYLTRYISIRAIALIIMGLFHVNFSYYNESLSLLPRSVYIILTTLSFFLIWLAYGKNTSKKRRLILQTIGIILLLAMAAIFRSGTPEQPGWMQIRWWGILGLIGWAYWLVALAYLFLREKTTWLIGFFLTLCLINIAIHLDFFALPAIFVGDTAHAVLVAGGMLCTVFYLQTQETNRHIWGVLVLSGLVLIGFGLAIAELSDGINKIRATPGWVHISMGISSVCYGMCVWWMDLQQKENPFLWISAAGTNTLTCYLLPYVWYAIWKMAGLGWPGIFNSGAGGVLRSLLVAFLIVQIAGWMEKKGIRIKV